METTIAFDKPIADEKDELSAQERLEQLFDAHHQRLFRLALRLTGQREVALDLVQEAFLRAARRPGSIPTSDAGATAWMVRVLVNLVRDRWRRQKRRGRAKSVPAATPSPRATSSATEAQVVVAQALAALSPRRRAIVVLAELDGESSRQIAALLGLRPATVRWHLSAARQQLRELLAPAAASDHQDGAKP